MPKGVFSPFVTMDQLVRRVTLDSYHNDKIAHLNPRPPRERLQVMVEQFERDKAVLGTHAIPGDEWWEWVWGTEVLMQAGGLALVRQGAIVYVEEHWIS